MAFKCYGNLVNESFLAGIVFQLLLVFMFFFPVDAFIHLCLYVWGRASVDVVFLCGSLL